MTSKSFSRRSLFFRSVAAGVGTYAISQNSLAASKATLSSSLYAPPIGIAKLNANENPYGYLVELFPGIGISMGQLLTIPMIIVGLLMIILVTKRNLDAN